MAIVRFKVNKLIRDNILQRLKNQEIKSYVHTMEFPQYLETLTVKLVEEANECLEAQDRADLIEELGDVMEVIHTLIQAHNIDMEEVEEKRLEKQTLLGGFEQKVYCSHIEIEESNPHFNNYALRPHKYPKMD